MSGEDSPNAVAEALRLLNNLLSLLSLTRAKSPQLASSLVVKRLPGEAYRAAQDLAGALRDWRADLKAAGVDLDRTLDDLMGDYDWWHFRRYRAVRNFRQRLAGLNSTFALLFDDVVAVALCFRAEELLVQSHKDAAARRQEIRAMVAPDRTLRQILDDAEALVEALLTQLGDMQ